MRFDKDGRPQFSVEGRAERWQRRYTGPWQTVEREVAFVVVSTRYRRRRRIEFVRLGVAWHDLWTHQIGRRYVLSLLRRLNRIIS